MEVVNDRPGEYCVATLKAQSLNIYYALWYNAKIIRSRLQAFLKNMVEENQKTEGGVPQSPSHAGKNIGMAVVAYILFFIPLLTDAKNDPFVKYHVKQGLVLFITSFILMIVGRMPVIGMFTWILNIGVLVLFIIGIMNAIGGKETPLPLIGHLADNFKF